MRQYSEDGIIMLVLNQFNKEKFEFQNRNRLVKVTALLLIIDAF